VKKRHVSGDGKHRGSKQIERAAVKLSAFTAARFFVCWRCVRRRTKKRAQRRAQNYGTVSACYMLAR
jgi:hypothetical protein